MSPESSTSPTPDRDERYEQYQQAAAGRTELFRALVALDKLSEAHAAGTIDDRRFVMESGTIAESLPHTDLPMILWAEGLGAGPEETDPPA